jgi:hypothetical protein
VLAPPALRAADEPIARLYRAVAPVDEDDLAADEVRGRRGQEESQVGNLHRHHRSQELDGPGADDAWALDGPQVRLNSHAAATLAGDGLPRRVETRGISAHDGDIGPGVGEDGCDLRADAREAPVTSARLP